MMNKTEIFRKIGGIISELNEQYQYLSENFERMNELELELFVANSNFLTDHVEILKKMNKSAEEKPSNDVAFTEASQTTSGLTESLSAEAVDSTLPQLDTASAEKKSIFPEAAEDELEFDFEKKSLEELYDRALSEEEQEIINNKLAHSGTIKEVQEEVPIVETEMKEAETLTSEKNISRAETELLVEQTDTAPTVNDVISSQRNYNTIGAELNKQPISDLKAGISLNDKLLFIKNLFNGYSLAYSEAIEILNRFDSFELAETFLRANYAEKNNWAANPSTVEKFYEVLSRRYLK